MTSTNDKNNIVQIIKHAVISYFQKNVFPCYMYWKKPNPCYLLRTSTFLTTITIVSIIVIIEGIIPTFVRIMQFEQESF